MGGARFGLMLGRANTHIILFLYPSILTHVVQILYVVYLVVEHEYGGDIAYYVLRSAWSYNTNVQAHA